MHPSIALWAGFHIFIIAMLVLDLGLLQLEMDHRPDGTQPHGYLTYLDYLIAEAANRGSEFRLGEGHRLAVERHLCTAAAVQRRPSPRSCHGQRRTAAEEHPAWTAQQVQDQITSTAKDMGVDGRDPEFGWGVVDAAAAVGAPAPGPTAP